jgi:HSP20 family protein
MKLLIPTRQNNGYNLSPLVNLSRELDRLFESPFTTGAQNEYQPVFAPALELRENHDNYQISVEVPGVDKKDVEVTLHDGVLTISGERKQETEVKDGEYVRTERAYGRFQRQVTLPQPVNADAVKAAYKDGVLTITLPKTAEAKPKQIAISAN